VVGILATLVLLFGVRPVAKRHLTASGPSVMGTEALIGMEAVALTRVDGQDGRVQLNGGEWSARSFDGEQVIASGGTVRVVRISGATALVMGDEPGPQAIEGTSA
jgi:membrane protein implicated in regulation of membrane protease activity